MFRSVLVTGIAALATVALVTPESQAQKGKGGGGGGAVRSAPHASSPHISSPRVSSPSISRPAGISKGVANPGAAHINQGAIRPQNFNNAIRPNNLSGVAGRPSAGFTPQGIRPGANNLSGQGIRPGNNNWSGNNNWAGHNGQFHNSRFNNNHFDHNHGSSFFFSPFGFGLGWGGWGLGWGYPNYGGYGGYYDSYPYYGGYGGVWDSYLYGGGGNYLQTPMPYTDQGAYLPQQQPTATTIAQIDVLVPDPNAQVWVDDALTSSKGQTRYFDSPTLQPGSDYSYTVKAAWTQPNGQAVTTQATVSVTAGTQAVVDFTQTPPKVTKVR